MLAVIKIHNMDKTELINDLICNAKDAYAFAKESGLEKPLVETSKNFIKWFGGLFSRKAHKEKLKLMEKLDASENDFTMLKSELAAQIEEHENLKFEFEKQLSILRQEATKSEKQETIKIIRSKNVVAGVNKIELNGDFIVGDSYSDKK
jgi:hypothetical protein